MEKILKSAYKLLKAVPETSRRQIVFIESHALIITNTIILYFDLKNLNIANDEYLQGKYLSFSDLDILIDTGFENVIPDKDGLLIDYRTIYKYSGSYTETTLTDPCFNRTICEKGIYNYKTNDGIVTVPVGFVRYLFQECRNNSPVRCDTCCLDLKLFPKVARIVTSYQKLYSNNLAIEFFKISRAFEEGEQMFMLLSENVSEYNSTNTFAICTMEMDNRYSN